MSNREVIGNHIREKLADKIDVSKDIILDYFLMKTLGNKEICVENFKGIIEYTDSLIKIKAKPRSIEIEGEHLELCNISDELLSVSGDIKKITFS